MKPESVSRLEKSHCPVVDLAGKNRLIRIIAEDVDLFMVWSTVRHITYIIFVLRVNQQALNPIHKNGLGF